MDNESRENLIRTLYSSMTDLPAANAEKPYYFDEATGTFYLLTGKKQIERPTAENAEKYFKDIIRSYRGTKDNDEFLKMVYCSIAVEAIAKMLGEAEE